MYGTSYGGMVQRRVSPPEIEEFLVSSELYDGLPYTDKGSGIMSIGEQKDKRYVSEQKYSVEKGRGIPRVPS